MESRVFLSAYTLDQFGPFGANATGASPVGTLVADPTGDLFGTASAGGAYGAGCVFELAAGSSKITTLASFDGANGASPLGLAIDSAGNLFGTTEGGGANGDGVVYEVARGSGAITTLVSFDGTNGRTPYAGVTLGPTGNIYGSTAWGGPSDDGTLFEIAAGSTTLTTLATFASSGGYRPEGVAVDAAGDLFGTNVTGGPGGEGTVFDLPAGSATVSTLASFNLSNGADPDAVTLDANGNLFGATEGGGTGGGGTVFEIAAGSTTLTTLAMFNVSNTGAVPRGVTLDASGNIYGTTWQDGANDFGTVFEIAKGSNAITVLAPFTASGGATYGGITLGGSGNLFGSTSGGTASPSGTIFKIAAGTSAMTSVATFDPTNGTNPCSGVTRDPSGDLFATTKNGGANGLGTVFEIPKGATSPTMLLSFNGTDGSHPLAGVTLDAAGDLFGTTSAGGGSGDGTVFEIVHGSNFPETLASFNGSNGQTPYAGLTLDAAGNLFGTTEAGGANGFGTVFEIAHGSAALTTVVAFNGSNGSYPQGGLTLDAAGNLFGTTRGGASGYGLVFEIPAGSNAITPIATFNGTNGGGPDTTLTLDPAGNIYGTTPPKPSAGHAVGGTVFEIAAGSASITTLAVFNGSNGSDPTGMTRDISGNLFGTTFEGGAANRGTVFEIASGSATITTLVSFAGANGSQPLSGITLDEVGNLYGTTQAGGISGSGTVFELAANTAASVTLSTGSNPSPADEPLTYAATVKGGVPDGATVTLVDASNNDAVVATGTLSGGSATLNISAWALLPGTHNLIAVYAGDANFAASESLSYVQTILTPAPSLVGGPVINGDNPNGLFNAAGQTSPGQQRSMIEDIVYTFNEPVTISDANQAFTLAVAGPAGGTLPATLYARAVAGSNGTQWAVSLTGMPEGAVGSIANGEYSITINPAYVFAAADGVTSMAAGTGRTDNFYRLYGDVFGTRNVTALDYSRFKGSLTTYNPMFDNYNTGNITALDYALFKKDLSIDYSGDGFVTTI